MNELVTYYVNGGFALVAIGFAFFVTSFLLKRFEKVVADLVSSTANVEKAIVQNTAELKETRQALQQTCRFRG